MFPTTTKSLDQADTLLLAALARLPFSAKRVIFQDKFATGRLNWNVAAATHVDHPSGQRGGIIVQSTAVAGVNGRMFLGTPVGASNRYPIHLPSNKPWHLGFRCAFPAVTAQSGIYVPFFDPTISSAMGYIGLLGSISTANIALYDNTGAVKVSLGAIDTNPHTFEFDFDGSSTVTVRKDSVVLGTTATWGAWADSTLVFNSSNGTDAVNRALTLRWVNLAYDVDTTA